MENDVCQVTCIHEDRVRKARRRMVDESTSVHLAELFRVLGDPTRIRILSALQEEELCVCDLAATVGSTQSAVSHQLRLLRAARLVKYRKEGKMVFYSLDDDHVARLFREGMEHVQKIQPASRARGLAENKTMTR